ncbi:MAG: cadherin domain-containing protein, partial [Planctomycetes bacterium]|nr:cadherin domain-containing protein [Planctomycetota bacterium]
GLGNDILDGGAGTDTVSYASATSGVTVNLATTTSQNTVGAGSDTITNFENILGSAFADTLTGNANDNVITGGAGNDVIIGGAGSDTLTGGAGIDQLTGGTGNDTFYVDAGTDTITDLGTGNDIVFISAGATANATATANWTATTASVNYGTATITANGFDLDVSAATGSSGWTMTNTGSSTAVTLVGSSYADTIIGGSAQDTLIGGGGNDTLIGGGNYSTSGIVTNGLLLRLDASNTASYPGTGTIWTDLSGNGNHATLVNGVGYDPSNGGSLVFDGINDYATTGKTIVPNSTSSYTVSAWYNRDRNNVGYEELLSQWTYATWLNGENPFFFGFNSSNVRFTSNWHSFPVSGAGTTGQWMQMVGVYTPTNASLYLNGNLVATSGTGFSYSGTGEFIIGRQGELPMEYFGGKLAGVAVYNRALNDAEINQNYSAPPTGLGIDTAVYSGNRSDYAISYNSVTQSYSITDNRSGSPDGTDTLSGIEQLRFADRVIRTSLAVNDAPNSIAISQRSVTITNPSFEVDTPTDGNDVFSASGWTLGGGSVGTFNPNSSQMPEGPTHGTNTLYSNGGSATQTLAELFSASTQYTLMVDVGDRTDTNIQGFAIRLYAGTLLVGETTTLSVPESGWQTAILNVDGSAFAGNGAAVGQALKIELTSTGVQTNFDNIRLFASDRSLTIAENAINGTVVGSGSTIDADPWDTHTYSLIDSAGGRFAINSSTGQLTVANGSLLNFEAATSHNIVVRATDQGGLTVDRMVTINLTNVNEAPVFGNVIVDNSTFGGQSTVSNTGQVDYFADRYVPVDTSGTYVVQVTANSGSTSALHFAGYNSATIEGYRIGYENYLVASGSVDTTLAQALNPGDTQIVLTDASTWYRGSTAHARNLIGGGYTDSRGVLQDLAYSFNGSFNFYNGVWAENGINGNVITLQSPWSGPALDVGATVRNICYGSWLQYNVLCSQAVTGSNAVYSGTVAGISSSGSFTSFRPGTEFINGIIRSNYYNGTGVTTTWSNMTIQAVDTKLAVVENWGAGSFVGRVLGSDPDAGNTLTYSLVDNAGGRFQIDSSTGTITVAANNVLNFEANPSHNITVRITDNSGAFTDRT